MKFIFPQNFNFKNKILGIIDYPTAIFNVIYFLIIWFICKLLITSKNNCNYIFVFTCVFA